MRQPYYISLTGLLAALLLLAGCANNNQEQDAADAAPAITDMPTAETTHDTDAAAPAAQSEVELLPPEPPPPGAENEFSTNFDIHSISYDEVLSGGPPKDGIPSIDDPQFVRVDEADEWLAPVEPVVAVEVGVEARAYPIQILTWHEIVNDTVNELPLTITFCPLCNTAIVFERSVDGEVRDFGTTGRLRLSNLIMYDRQNETWWQQATGEAIAGDLTGTQLDFYPAEMIAWEDFRENHPDGLVLSRETGFNRRYGENPYVGYDDVNSTPFLFQGEVTPEGLPPMARVLAVEIGAETVAYPYDVLDEVRVINDTVENTDVVVFWEAGAASALDTGFIAEGRNVGAANAYNRELDGQTLTFAADGAQFVDEQTGSTWDARGQAIDGALAGQSLEPVVAVNHFWFSWAAFQPETRIYMTES